MLPRIGITMGDPAGIGPEILAKALTSGQLSSFCTPIVIGDARVLEQALQLVGGVTAYARVVKLPGDLIEGRTYLLDLSNIAPDDYSWGEVSAAAGQAAGEFIEKAVALALAKKIDAVATNPINKEAFTLAGFGKRYPGHTEMLASLTGSKRYCMMLAHGELRVCHVSTHVSLRDAIDKQIKQARILEVIELAHDACQRLGIQSPAIGVAGLNPHASEGGLFGDEEQREIIPAVEAAKGKGIDAQGPIPADTLFSRALGGEFAAVIALYHDQGHIPVKLAGFRYSHDTGAWDMSGVNVTLGLPIIRTSVDHGTAFDKAGEGEADHRSLVEAIRYAARLATSAR